jgi:hypothetical protein
MRNPARNRRTNSTLRLGVPPAQERANIATARGLPYKLRPCMVAGQGIIFEFEFHR